LGATAEEAVQVEASGKEPLEGTGTILVAEDEISLRKLVGRVLEGLGYGVILAATASEALELVERGGCKPDLLLTDVILPGEMQGNELARVLTAADPGLAVIYMSGYTRNAIVHAGRLDPGVNFLEKPFTPEALGSAVREVLGRRTSPR